MAYTIFHPHSDLVSVAVKEALVKVTHNKSDDNSLKDFDTGTGK